MLLLVTSSQPYLGDETEAFTLTQSPTCLQSKQAQRNDNFALENKFYKHQGRNHPTKMQSFCLEYFHAEKNYSLNSQGAPIPF